MVQVLLTPSFFYHGIVRIPLFGCCPQHRTYRCWRNFELKRTLTFKERIYISFLLWKHIHHSDLFRYFPEVITIFLFKYAKQNEEKTRRRKRLSIFHIWAKYVFERRFTAKHLTMLGLFLTRSQSVRAKKKGKKRLRSFFASMLRRVKKSEKGKDSFFSSGFFGVVLPDFFPTRESNFCTAANSSVYQNVDLRTTYVGKIQHFLQNSAKCWQILKM